MHRAVVAAVSGTAATAPMTVAMAAMHTMLPCDEQYPIGPAVITDNIARKTGIEQHMSGAQRAGAAAVAHFGYGATAALPFALLGGTARRHPVAAGVAYGLAVWAGSYAGWLPALGILEPPNRQPRGRAGLMVLGHVVWGAALGIAYARLARRS
jgi:uncharacterized membrane protein YagU involved in acid resistance